MPKRLLFIESNTTGTGMLALDMTRRLALEPVFLTSDPSRYRGLDRTGAVIVQCDTNSSSELRRAIGRMPRSGIMGVTTTSEFYLLAVAMQAEFLSLPGNPASVVKVCRNKAAVRRALEATDVLQPRFAEISSLAEVNQAVEFVGLPCVVKPVDDSGSNNVRVCGYQAEAASQVATVLAVLDNTRGQRTTGTALVEEYVEGPEFSVEMFCYDGQAQCIGITRKTVSGPPFCVETGHLYPADLDDISATAIIETVGALLKTVGVRSGPTHAEVRLGPEGPAVIELNCRLAGGMIPELIRLADGVDLVENQLRCAIGERPAAIAARHGWAGIRFITAGRQGVFRGVAGIDAIGRSEGIVQAVVTMRPGTQVGPARSAYDRIGFVIASGDSPAAVEAALSATRMLEPLLD